MSTILWFVLQFGTLILRFSITFTRSLTDLSPLATGELVGESKAKIYLRIFIWREKKGEIDSDFEFLPIYLRIQAKGVQGEFRGSWLTLDLVEMSNYTGGRTDHEYLDLSFAYSNTFEASWVEEGLSEPDSSPQNFLSDELRDMKEDLRDKVALLGPSPTGMSIARLHTVVNEQRYYLGEAQSEIAAMRGDIVAVDNQNQQLAERLSGISTVHVLVCLKRDQLKRFRYYALWIVIVLIIVLICSY